ncbi:MAG: hypothetical protein M3O36_07965 [Myxococcota bacterium]|nr:hypothetical protein [Myxococcota bacterium]
MTNEGPTVFAMAIKAVSAAGRGSFPWAPLFDGKRALNADIARDGKREYREPPTPVHGDGRGAAFVAASPCPAVCTGGCGASGATCTIVVTVQKQADIRCPPGRACVVHCAGTQVCADYSIYCAAAQPCTVVCEGDEACSSNTIARGAASALCVECIANGNPGCNSAVCVGACSSHCVGVGGCGGSCLGCAPVAACPR